MNVHRVYQSIQRTPEELARLKAIRDDFQSRKPSLKELLATGDYTEPIMQRQYMAHLEIANALEVARTSECLSLEDVSQRTGVDVEALIQMEAGTLMDLTLTQLNRVASLFEMHVDIGLQKNIPDPIE